MALYHLVGVGGSGMSALAQLLIGMGHKVSGSDRNYDRGIDLPVFDLLSYRGIQLFRQDGSGVKPEVNMVVVSTAVEECIEDVVKANQLHIPILKRAELLAQLFNQYYGIAIAGTSGKSTVTGMIGHILTIAGRDPVIINGGHMKNYSLNGQPNNVRIGLGKIMIIEGDESDGSIINYHPAFSLINTISKDHKDIPELIKIFQFFADQTKEKVIINADCSNSGSLKLNPSRTITFSLVKESQLKGYDLKPEPLASTFRCQGKRFHLQIPGIHNIYNALAAIALAFSQGVSIQDIQEGLETFKGINRRFDLIGEVDGIRIIDDFAHNPEKIAATIKAASLRNSRRILVFQPHGFGPTRFLKDELIETFISYMSDYDILFIPEIYYAGGTVSCDISSKDLVKSIKAKGKDARYGENREIILKTLLQEIQTGDTIIIMGGRDDTLTLYCRQILHLLHKK